MVKYIAIINYGMGNLRSVQKALEFLGYRAEITDKKLKIKGASAVILPGVGAFPKAMDELEKRDLIETIKIAVKSGKLFLGICLGMQILFSESEEFGLVKGLDIIKGKVVRFKKGLKVPHMGWNQVDIKKNSDFFRGIPDNSFMYFVHSYYCKPTKKDVVLTMTDYGQKFASSIYQDNLFACQFHPEKSQKWGLKLLSNFGDLI